MHICTHTRHARLHYIWGHLRALLLKSHVIGSSPKDLESIWHMESKWLIESVRMCHNKCCSANWIHPSWSVQMVGIGEFSCDETQDNLQMMSGDHAASDQFLSASGSQVCSFSIIYSLLFSRRETTDCNLLCLAYVRKSVLQPCLYSNPSPYRWKSWAWVDLTTAVGCSARAIYFRLCSRAQALILLPCIPTKTWWEKWQSRQINLSNWCQYLEETRTNSVQIMTLKVPRRHW